MRDVDHFNLLGLAAIADAITEHHPAERTTSGDRGGIEIQRLIHALVIDPLSEVLFHPHTRTACATTESGLCVARHLGECGSGCADQLTWRLVDLVMSAQVARVVVGDRARLATSVHRLDRDQLLIPNETVEQLGVVQHAVGSTDLGVLAAQGVEAVGAGDDDLAVDAFDAGEQFVDGLDVLRCQLLE